MLNSRIAEAIRSEERKDQKERLTGQDVDKLVSGVRRTPLTLTG